MATAREWSLEINRGRYGDVSLDGLAMGFAAIWPKAIHEGNGTVCLFFDERANPQQRGGPEKIASGQDGGSRLKSSSTRFPKSWNHNMCHLNFILWPE